MARPSSQRSLEELLPPVHQPSWVLNLAALRAADLESNTVLRERHVQFGLGFLTAIYEAGMLQAGDRDDLRELLLSPRLHR